MKTLYTLLLLTFLTYHEGFAQTEFELEPTQSMLMTGKGPGQDATINPYDGQDCYAIVKNIGKRSFSVRVQQAGKIIEEVTVLKKEVKRVTLLKGYALYLDPNPEGKIKASVDYKKFNE